MQRRNNQFRVAVQTRRLAYFYLLPLPSAGGALFINNSNNNKPLTWLVYYMCRLLLPRLLRINASTAARGRQKLLAEFDYLDGLIIQQQQQQAGAGQACDTASATADGGSGAPRLPFYLTGSKMTVAGEAVCLVNSMTQMVPLIVTLCCCQDTGLLVQLG